MSESDTSESVLYFVCDTLNAPTERSQEDRWKGWGQVAVVMQSDRCSHEQSLLRSSAVDADEALGGDTQRGIRPRFDGVSWGILRYPEVSVNMRHCGGLRDAYKNTYI